MSKTFYLLNSVAAGSSYGSLQDGGSVTTATTATGWTVGTTAATAYANQNYASKVAAGSFGATAQPAAAPANAGECWRSTLAYTGSFEAGTWTVKLSVIAVANTASGAGKLRVRLWKSASATCATPVEVTPSGAVATGAWSNLTTSTAQNLSLTFTTTQFACAAEYLFLEVACEIDTASGNAAADVLVRIDGTNSVITTPQFDASSNADCMTGCVESSADSTVKTVAGAQMTFNADASMLGMSGTVVTYNNTGWYAAGSTWESWPTTGAPASSAVNPKTGHTVTSLSSVPLS